MKQKLFIIFLVFSLTYLAFFTSCDREKEGGCGSTNISKFNLTKSHHTGEDCYNCHKDGGEGDGCFNAAGTVYDSSLANTYPNATVKLYSDPNGTGDLKATIEVDGKGNFYTTETIYGLGLYATVTGTGGTTQYMTAKITKGDCNRCHGTTTSKIWVK
jgi:hypothetical protein